MDSSAAFLLSGATTVAEQCMRQKAPERAGAFAFIQKRGSLVADDQHGGLEGDIVIVRTGNRAA
jgi:hypothetical protein